MQELIEKYLQAAKEKNIQALDDIFTEHAVYIESTGAIYNGLAQIKMWFEQVTAGGDVTAWDVKRIFDMGDTGVVEWYFEYQIAGADVFSFDGVSIVETENGKIKKWSEFAQTKDKTYPFEG
ncbi:nuclear transport factor 2 family protein [Ureibacillus suwonensis]|jgi:ketosteroid isomerase-like protein|uniref:Nuclear transport factor 2 family protein n=1 Tax=Ureibacillus suwonensis TaxID=313007 RepID=A0ABW0RAB7_9BACL